MTSGGRTILGIAATGGLGLGLGIGGAAAAGGGGDEETVAPVDEDYNEEDEEEENDYVDTYFDNGEDDLTDGAEEEGAVY